MNADNLTPQQEAAVMAARLEVTVAGAPRRLPVLPRRGAREWRALWRERFAAETSAEDLGQAFGAAAELPGEALLDMIVAYDEAIDSRTGEPYHVPTLGGRDWLDANATDREISALYEAIAEETFAPLVPAGLSPQATKALSMLQAVALIEAVALRQASFIATRSPTGALTLPPSTNGSPTPKSPSSGSKTRKRASKSSEPA